MEKDEGVVREYTIQTEDQEKHPHLPLKWFTTMIWQRKLKTTKQMEHTEDMYQNWISLGNNELSLFYIVIEC